MGTPKTTMANLIRHICLFQVVVPMKEEQEDQEGATRRNRGGPRTRAGYLQQERGSF